MITATNITHTEAIFDGGGDLVFKCHVCGAEERHTPPKAMVLATLLDKSGDFDARHVHTASPPASTITADKAHDCTCPDHDDCGACEGSYCADCDTAPGPKDCHHDVVERHGADPCRHVCR